MYLQISPSDGKLWRYDFTNNKHGKSLALGTNPDITLQEAREAHLQTHKNIAKGIALAIKKKQAKADSEKKNANTFVLRAN